MSVLPAIATLAWREVIRFVRQRSRLTGALLQPLVFWVLMGAGLKGSFRPPGAGEGGGPDYAEYFFPGILALVALFSAIFSTISVVEDRRSGFLQGVLVAPVPRWSVVAGQAAGSTLLAGVQAGLVLLLAPVAGIPLTWTSGLTSAAVLLLAAFGLSCLGLSLAWKMGSTQGFHAIMNLLLLPMWLLSGAFFPAEGSPAWLRGVMSVNPMTYAMTALRRTLYGEPPGTVPLLVMVVFGAGAWAFASVLARRASPQ